MAPRKSKNHIEGQLILESLWAEPEEVVNEIQGTVLSLELPAA